MRWWGSATARLRARIVVKTLLRLALTCLLPGLCAWLFASSLPLVPQGGDAVPGRLGMATLSCHGTSDLARVDWVRVAALRGQLPYYLVLSADRRAVVSTFGPGPATWGRLFFEPPLPGMRLTDLELAEAARRAAAAALGLSTSLLVLALLSTASSWVAVVGGLTAALSFGGVVGLGRGLFQQTPSLMLLMAALAAAAHARRYPWLLPVALGCGVLSVTLRPADLPLGAAVMAYALWQARAALNSPSLVITSALITLGAAFPVLSYDLWYFDRLLPVAQLSSNARMAEQVFVFTPRHIGTSLAGLLVSPARGLLWFGPVVLLALLKWRSPLAVGLLGQLLLIAVFHKWWGGLAFGPRLLSAAVWLGVYLVLAEPRTPRVFGFGALAVTGLVGLLGALRYDPRSWELPNDPDRHPERLFSITRSPWPSLVRPPAFDHPLRDAPPGPFLYCPPGLPFALLSPLPRANETGPHPKDEGPSEAASPAQLIVQ